jgi:hypothetical protein
VSCSLCQESLGVFGDGSCGFACICCACTRRYGLFTTIESIECYRCVFVKREIEHLLPQLPRVKAGAPEKDKVVSVVNILRICYFLLRTHIFLFQLGYASSYK